MVRLISHGVEPTLGRHLFSLEAPHLSDLREPLKLPTPHFVAFVACDSTRASVGEMSDVGAWLLSQGAAVIATWGPGCEKFHDIIDETDVERRPEYPDDAVVLTTWHDSESLAEALWFAVGTISAAPAFDETCRTVVAISVGNSEWQAEIDRWLAAPQQLAETVLGDSGVGGGA